MKSSISASRRRWSPFILKNECEIQRDLSGGNPSSAFKMFIHMQKSRTAGLMFNKWSVAHTRVKFLSVLTDPKWYPARQSLRLDPSASAFHNKFCINSAQLIDEVIRCCPVLSWLMVVGLLCFAEAKCLKDEEVLQTLPVGTTASFYFSDLGPQLTWGTVSPHVHRRTTFRTIQYCLHAFLVIVVNSVVSVCEPVVDYKDAPACNIWFCQQQMPEMIWFTWSFSHGHKSECACLSSGNDSAHERGVFHRLTVLEKKGLLCTMVCQVNTICA